LAEIVYGYAAEPGDLLLAPGAKPVNQPLFCPLTPAGEILSRRFFVRPGDVFFIRAFNLLDDYKIFTNFVSIGQGAQPVNHAQLATPVVGQDIYTQRMTLGGADNWILTSSNPQMLISLPGSYRLELESPDMLGEDLWVEFTAWKQDGPLAAGVVR
jgi:hypothetical protein